VSEEIYEVYALKYADRPGRRRGDSFIFDADHDSPHPIDYFFWVVKNAARTVVVDTGYDAKEGARRDRPVLKEPAACLADFGINPESVETVVITHLHYDHAGTLDIFPKATFHIQAEEVAYATGPCMAYPGLNHPFTAEHVCNLIRKIYSGRVVFHAGDAGIAPGVEVAAVGGHTKGLQAVRVKTREGWLLLASDAAHYYENYLAGKAYPIVVNVEDMLASFRRLPRLASSPGLVIPGHDPLVCDVFPLVAGTAGKAAVHRLDIAPPAKLQALLADFGTGF